MGAGLGNRLAIASDREQWFFHLLCGGEPFEDTHSVIVRVREGDRHQHILRRTKIALRHTQADAGAILRSGSHSRSEEQSGKPQSTTSLSPNGHQSLASPWPKPAFIITLYNCALCWKKHNPRAAWTDSSPSGLCRLAAGRVLQAAAVPGPFCCLP